MKTVNLTDGTWKRAKQAALDAEVPLRAWVEQAALLALEHGIVWGVADIVPLTEPSVHAEDAVVYTTGRLPR